jgi:hypothetical protein
MRFLENHEGLAEEMVPGEVSAGSLCRTKPVKLREVLVFDHDCCLGCDTTNLPCPPIIFSLKTPLRIVMQRRTP